MKFLNYTIVGNMITETRVSNQVQEKIYNVAKIPYSAHVALLYRARNINFLRFRIYR